MKLTTEQKINLLILAGFEPYMFSSNYRLLGPSACLYTHSDGRWWDVDAGRLPAPPFYKAVQWGELAHKIPDELIYQAIGATPG